MRKATGDEDKPRRTKAKRGAQDETRRGKEQDKSCTKRGRFFVMWLLVMVFVVLEGNKGRVDETSVGGGLWKLELARSRISVVSLWVVVVGV